ncbi:Lipoprotein signal peptidase [Clarias magur]|uniref:Lipoprotein signal peptidase n=1 Tax=Clarias magur TaxID=1594786 RepID=A0A8J4UDY8_CLAMG|nr:Lipoprotein signal peptidase [Clarias magur]
MSPECRRALLMMIEMLKEVPGIGCWYQCRPELLHLHDYWLDFLRRLIPCVFFLRQDF